MLTWLNPVVAATTRPLVEVLQLANGDWEQVVIDGVRPQPGDRVLVKDEPSQIPFQEGIYQVLDDGHWNFIDEAEPGECKLLVASGDTQQDSIFFLSQGAGWVAVLPRHPENSPAGQLIDRRPNLQTLGKPGTGIGEGWDDDPLSLGRR